jgi:hypothetical protein
MIKDVLRIALFFALLGTVHYCILDFFPPIQPANDFYLIYALLMIINLMGATLFYLGRNLEVGSFAGLYLIFTTIQLLGAMSFALAIRVIREEDAKQTLLHFVAAFMLSLIFQSYYYIKRSNSQG